METTVKCPECSGLGVVSAGVEKIEDGNDERNVYTLCPRCKGAKVLPEHDPQLLLERIQKLERALDIALGDIATLMNR